MVLEAENDAFLAALESLLRTIIRMGGALQDELYIAPTEGHELPSKQLEGLSKHKTPEVIDLLKRMPYAGKWRCPELAPFTPMMHYWGEPNEEMWLYQAWAPEPGWGKAVTDRAPLVQPWELPFAGNGDARKKTIILDLSQDRLIARICDEMYLVGCVIHGRSADHGCPSFCPGKKSQKRVPAVELLKEYERNFLAAVWMPDSEGNVVGIQDADDDEHVLNRTQKAYLDCGWPGSDFDLAELRAILESDDFRNFSDFSDTDSSGDGGFPNGQDP